MFKEVKNEILSDYNPNNKYLIILSAINNLTNSLIKLANDFNLSHLKNDLIKEGENISCIGLFKELKNQAKSNIIYPKDIDLTIEENQIKYIDIDKLLDYFKRYNILILPGFYGINNHNEIELLSRNGTDTTALYIYNEFKNNNILASCNLYKDEILFQVDPKIEKSNSINNISFDELSLIKDYNTGFISKDGFNLIINNQLDISIINFFNKEKTIISHIPSTYNLLGKFFQKGYIIEISNIKNKKIYNYITKIKCNIISEESDKISFFINRLIIKHLQILKLLDSSLIYTIKNKYKIIKVYKTNIVFEYYDNFTEAIYEKTK